MFQDDFSSAGAGGWIEGSNGPDSYSFSDASGSNSALLSATGSSGQAFAYVDLPSNARAFGVQVKVNSASPGAGCSIGIPTFLTPDGKSIGMVIMNEPERENLTVSGLFLTEGGNEFTLRYLTRQAEVGEWTEPTIGCDVENQEGRQYCDGYWRLFEDGDRSKFSMFPPDDPAVARSHFDSIMLGAHLALPSSSHLQEEGSDAVANGEVECEFRNLIVYDSRVPVDAPEIEEVSVDSSSVYFTLKNYPYNMAYLHQLDIYWRGDEINWHPGYGEPNKPPFRGILDRNSDRNGDYGSGFILPINLCDHWDGIEIAFAPGYGNSENGIGPWTPLNLSRPENCREPPKSPLGPILGSVATLAVVGASVYGMDRWMRSSEAKTKEETGDSGEYELLQD